MRVSRIITVAIVLFAFAAAGGNAAAQQCPKGKLRLYTSWPMQGAMLPEGTGMKNGVDLAVSEVNGTVAGYCLEVVNLDDASPQTGKWDGAVEAENANKAVGDPRSEEHTSELQSPCNLVCRLLLEKKKIVGTLIIGHMFYCIDLVEVFCSETSAL